MPSIKLVQGDITTIKVDAVVNAANKSLLGGGGVDGAIHRAGGPEILEECKTIGGCETGEAVITTAGKMPAHHVIHTVGPVWHGGQQNEPELLQNCYTNSLKIAVENNCQSIAFPCISTGVYHFPKTKAAEVAVSAIRRFLKENDSLKEVQLVSFDKENYKALEKAIGEL